MYALLGKFFSQIDNELFQEVINSIIQRLVSDVFTKNIDIFQNKNYTKFNFNSLYWEKTNAVEEVKKYLNLIINKSNVSKFINEFIQISSSSEGYGYQVNIHDLFNLCLESTLDNLLNEADQNDDNIFVFEVYNKSKQIGHNSFKSAILRHKQVKRFVRY